MNFFARVASKFKRTILKPKTPVTRHCSLTALGTEYGSWSFLHTSGLSECTIISCGAGEDISFDIAFAAKYQAKVLIVDPTPRAISHVSGVLGRIGESPACSFVDGGKQPIDAYDLSKLSQGQISHVQKALWNEATNLKFYLPPNKDHVSHSIVNYQNDYANDTEALVVESVRLVDLTSDLQIPHLEILKLDIEGAEIEVIYDMLASKIFPKQLLIEFDEMNHPSKKGKLRIEEAYKSLIKAGYDLVFFDGYANFCFILSEHLDDLSGNGV